MIKTIISKEDMVDLLFYQVMPLIRNIDDNVDTHLYQEFYNGTNQCYQLLTIGVYNLIYMPKRKELVVAYRLENDGSWGSGDYYSLDSRIEFPPTIVKSALIDFVKRVGLIDLI